MLIPPLIGKWNELKDEDKDLFPLLEVSLARSLFKIVSLCIVTHQTSAHNYSVCQVLSQRCNKDFCLSVSLSISDVFLSWNRIFNCVW